VPLANETMTDENFFHHEPPCTRMIALGDRWDRKCSLVQVSICHEAVHVSLHGANQTC
jgi:hypothetical protein